MEIYIKSIRDALAAGNWLAALVLALSLPDICGGCETPGPNNSRVRYERWFNRWIQPAYTEMVPDIDAMAADLAAMPKTPKLLKGQSKKYDIASITRYIADTAAWMDRQPLIPYVSLSGRDCYALRCAITHQGSDQTDRQAAADVLRRFEFVASSIDAINFHNNLSGDQLQLDVTKFCNEICEAVIAWEAQTSGDPGIEAEKSRLLKILRFGV